MGECYKYDKEWSDDKKMKSLTRYTKMQTKCFIKCAGGEKKV